MKSYYNSWPWNNPQISSNFGQLDAYDTKIVIGLEQNNNLATKLTYILKDYIIIFFTSYGVKEPRLKVWEIPWVPFFPRSFYKKLKINYFDIWHILTQKTCRICYYYTVNRHYKVEEDMEVKVNEAVFFAIFFPFNFSVLLFPHYQDFSNFYGYHTTSIKSRDKTSSFFQKLYYNLIFRFILVQL